MSDDLIKIKFTGQLEGDTLIVITNCVNVECTYDTNVVETTCSFSFVLDSVCEITPETYDIVSTAEVSFLDGNNERVAFKFEDVRNHRGFLIALDEILETGKKYTFTSPGYKMI